MARHRKGLSKAGRPKKEGDRYPGGQLKPPGPNPVVLANRRAMLGAGVDPARGENALDVALARSWLTEEQHRSARAYARLHRRSGMALPAGARVSNLGEAAGEMARVAQVGSSYVPVRDLEGDACAAALLRSLWARLTPQEVRALTDIALLENWPQWVVLRLRGVNIHDRERSVLISALETVSAHLDPRTQARYANGRVVHV